MRCEIEEFRFNFHPIIAYDFDEFTDFASGNPSMDRFLKYEAFLSHLERDASTTLVFIDNKLVAYYTLKRRTAPFIEFDNDSEDENSAIVEVDCLEIARLAVIESMQKHGVGSAIIKYILEMAETINERYVILFAVEEKIDWYQKRGFKLATEELYKKDGDIAVVYMYLDMTYRDMLNEYYENP